MADAPEDAPASDGRAPMHVEPPETLRANHSLPAGTRVLIRGLINRTDLNGRVGKIASFDEKKQRYNLQAESCGDLNVEGFRVRVDNCVDLRSDPPNFQRALEYGRLLLQKHHFNEATLFFFKSLQYDDEKAEPYYGLACAFAALDNPTRAAESALAAMERTTAGTRQWALAACAAFHALCVCPEDGIVEPDWWTDGELKKLSALVVSAAYEDAMAHDMRAQVLRGGQTVAGKTTVRWYAKERSPEELREASEAAQRASSLRGGRERNDKALEEDLRAFNLDAEPPTLMCAGEPREQMLRL